MYIAGFVAFTFFVDPARCARAAAGRRARPLRSVGWEAWVWALAAFAVDLHADVHRLPHQPGRAVGRALRRASPTGSASTASAAAARSRTSTSSCCSATSGRCCCSARSARSSRSASRRVLRAFLVWGFALSLAIYSWAGEKFAWLVLHPLLPLILLAGLGVQALWEARGTRLGRVGARGRRGRGALRRRSRRGGPTSSTAPTRASCWSPRSPPRRSSACADAGRRRSRARRAEAVGHGRLRRRRDVPLRLVLPRPRRRLPRPHDRAVPADTDVLIMTEASRERLRRSSPATTAAASRSASGGCATTARWSTPGAWLRWSPSASRGTPPAGCRSGSTCARAPTLRLLSAAATRSCRRGRTRAGRAGPTSPARRRRSRCARAARRRRSGRRSGRAAGARPRASALV